MSLAWVAQQIARLAGVGPEHSVNVPRFNPTPPGVIRKGSATDAVLSLMVARPDVFLTHGQITAATARSKTAVDWALIFLRSEGLVDAVPDHARNVRFRRYCVTSESLSAARARLLAAERYPFDPNTSPE